MTCGATGILCRLLLLTLLFSGIEATVAAAAHAEHGPAHEQPIDGGDPEDADHADHCCHMASHLVGVIIELPLPALRFHNDVGSRFRFLRLGVGAPPPVPPPTA